MEFRPWPYQQRAIDMILGQPAVGLFLDMGMGKTVITLTAIDQLLYDRYEVSRVLVIAPLRVAQDTWARESQKWDHLRHLRISRILGSEADRLSGLTAAADIWVINRENVAWLVGHAGNHWPFDMVVIDELSSFKSSKAQRFRALRKVRLFIRRIVGLTGTPAPNGLIDLWPQLYLLDQGARLGRTVGGYREQYFQPGRRNRTVVFNWVPKSGSEESIHQAINDICVSMRAVDYLDLPDRISLTDLVQLDSQARGYYRQMEQDWLLDLAESEIAAATAAVVTNKLLQIANGAAYDDTGTAIEIHQAKLDALEDILEAANGQPVLVYYSYRHDLARIKARFGGRPLDSDKDIAAWNAGEVPLLLAHPASAGHGLNLQDGGHQIVWYGLTWSLELYQQANARLHRQGQKHPVIIHHLIAEGTMDEAVLQALQTKSDSQDVLLEAVKARIEEIGKCKDLT